MTTIVATLNRCRHGQPLVELTSQPFSGLEIRPDELRHMAQQLIAIADLAVRLPTGGKHWRPTRIELCAGPQQASNSDPLDQVMAGMLKDVQTRNT